MALLELDELTRRFGGLVAVDHVSMRVEESEVRAVIGPNGAGKSTLFNLITGVLKPNQGSVRFAGESVAGLSTPRICQRGIARTFQPKSGSWVIACSGRIGGTVGDEQISASAFASPCG